ncbi:E3 ubiquitin-protein ligase RNF185, partial [Mucuna pruriens]
MGTATKYMHRNMDIDSNEEAAEPPQASVAGSLLEELASLRQHLQDRIRHLDEITRRATERERGTPPPVDSTIELSKLTVTANPADEGTKRRETGKGSKTKGAELVAEALGKMDTGGSSSKKKGGGSGDGSQNFFDCNICLEMAKEPVVTCCGHLFCRACFDGLECEYSNARVCPVCEGEVIESGITPIYGKGNVSGTSDSRGPPPPPAHRVETFRRQLVGMGEPSATTRSLQRLENFTAMLADRLQAESQTLNTAPSPISWLMSQGAFSSLLSSLNSATNSTETLLVDLYSYIQHNRIEEDDSESDSDSDSESESESDSQSRSQSQSQSQSADS